MALHVRMREIRWLCFSSRSKKLDNLVSGYCLKLDLELFVCLCECNMTLETLDGRKEWETA